MNRQLGIAYCGLVCAACSGSQDCAGCRADGCKDFGFCKNYKCCREKRLTGCWECGEFPCRESMLDKTRIRAFAMFAKKYGTDMLLDCLERNEQNGTIYHYPGGLVGDYDIPKTEDEIIEMILHGK